jgi:hypothetical protein
MKQMMTTMKPFRACLKKVASAILADVEPGLPARRNGAASETDMVKSRRFASQTVYPGGKMPPSTAGKDACRHIIRPALKLAARALALAAGFTALTAAADDAVSLAGTWRFQLDRTDAGQGERWFSRALPETVKLPGTLVGQGIGDDISTNTPWVAGIVNHSWFTEPEYAKYREPGNVMVPWWLQPEKYYAGAAWFQRDIEIPANWAGRRVVLFLERAHWETRLWVGANLIGTNNSLSTPHEYDLGQLAPGKHTLTLRVDNRRIVDIGENSHGISDHTQGNWSGIVGKIGLVARSAVWMEEIQVHPNLAKHGVKVVVKIGNRSGKPGTGNLVVSIANPASPGSDKPATPMPVFVNWDSRGGLAEFEIAPQAKQAWDEFAPQIHKIGINLVDLADNTHRLDSKAVTFGIREISTSGTQFIINGQKTFIRGTLECAIFPKTGHPPMEVEEWRRIIRVAKSYGLNLLRFHSYCPPEAAFQAADELGMYLHVETCWPNQSTTLGDGKPVDQWVYDETDRILKYYGNHPSFVLMACGNEPGGGNHKAFLAKYVAHFKAKDPRRLWTSGAGWPELAENQWHCSPGPRIQGWEQGLNSRINAKPPETTTDYRDYIAGRSVPVISHEIGQWCVYPNFDEIRKYTGHLKPKNFEIFRDRLEANGMGHLAKQFLLASGKLQTLCYKEDIESAFRTPGMGGFELLDLHDFPGQGTALVGVLDPFWQEKGHVTAKEFRRFCNSTVPLARLKKRVFTTDETLEAEIEVARFSTPAIGGARWKLVSEDGKAVASGELPSRTEQVFGSAASLGRIGIDLGTIPAPHRYKLAVVFEESVAARQTTRRSKYENDWDVWVYPARAATEPAPDILVTAQFDEAAQKHLASGGKLLLTIPGKQVRNYDKDPVKLGFSSIFWNTSWTGRQAPTTLGILCNPKHPALAGFPTEFHSNWQWWHLIHRAGALRLDLLPAGTEPVVRVIDDWATARPLGLVVEGKVGAGRFIVCGFDLTGAALTDPVSRQMRASLLRYLASDKCRPATEFSEGQISSLILQTGKSAQRGIASIKSSSEEPGYEAGDAVDGDPATFWHSTWSGYDVPQPPHDLLIELNAPLKCSGFSVLPRQDGNRNGWIKDYAFHVSNDGVNWGGPVAKGTFAADRNLKTVRFPAPVTARFVKLVALSGHTKTPFASLAEFNLIEPK